MLFCDNTCGDGVKDMTRKLTRGAVGTAASLVVFCVALVHCEPPQAEEVCHTTGDLEELGKLDELYHRNGKAVTDVVAHGNGEFTMCWR